VARGTRNAKSLKKSFMNTIAPQELSDFDFTKLQGQYQAQFGIIMNKQVLLLFEAQRIASQKQIALLEKKLIEHTEMLNNNFGAVDIQHGKYITAIEKATNVIENKKGQIITENPKVIKEHNRKYWIICTLILLLSIIGAYLYNDYHNSQVEYQKVTNTLNSYPKIYKFQLLAQNVKIVANPNGKAGEFLELTLQKEGEGAKVGANYIDDPKEKRILVPLHFSKEPL
jgi:hypothetical protein